MIITAHVRLLHGFKYLMYAATALLTACGTTLPSAPPPDPDAAPVWPAGAASVVAPPAAPLSSRALASAAQIAALQAIAEQQNRLNVLAAPILLGNVALCKRNARNVSGFVAKTQYAYASELAGAARTALGLDERLRVMTVLPGSAAVQSGLLTGDVVLAVGDSKIAPGPNAERDAAKLIETAGRGHAAINLTILRGNTALTLNLALSRACALDIELGNSDNVNSYTDGRRVMITRGMLNATRSDEELAFVLAKEIAQGVLTTAARPGMRAMIERLLQNQPVPPATVRAPVLQPYVPVSDATADKLALYMLARAGGNIEGALSFWQNLAAKYPASLANSFTALHPATPYRLSVIKAVTASIKLKQLNQLPLIP